MGRKNILTRTAFLLLITITAVQVIKFANAESYWQQAKNAVSEGAQKLKDLRKGNHIEPKHKAKDREELVSPEYNKEILADQGVAETPLPGEGRANESDGQLSEEEINKIWAEHMHDFVPEDMINVIVESKSTETLFEEIIQETPKTVKGAYYVLNGNEQRKIDCMIYDPKKNVVYKRK